MMSFQDDKPMNEFPIDRLSAVQPSTRLALYHRLTLAKKFIETNYIDELTVKEISMEVGISEYHFFRLFKSLFHTTPYQYLLRVRIQHAYSLLQTGTCTVSQVAYAVGFTDLFSFSKFFKKHMGIPPSRILKKQADLKAA